LFHEWLRSSDALPYAAPAAPRICPSGDPAAGLMVLAGMPSTDDCASGAWLSGAAGRLFDRMLAAIGRSRETIYLAGLSCVRPASGRFDAAGSARCGAIAKHHIALVAPKTVLLIGDASARALLGLGAAQARGRVHRIETPSGSFDAVVTLSPEFLLNQPGQKALAWADLQLLMETLK
jgi:DNA polymerase